MIGIEAVAVYAAALSVLQLVRSFNGIVFSPYTSRYNHFAGLNDYEGLTHFVRKMVVLFAPVLIVPILTLSLSSKPFIISWVGEQYTESAILVSFLVLSFVFNFIKDPVNQYFVAMERNRILIKYSVLTPIIFWVGVISLVGLLSTKAFAIMKFVAPIVNVVAYWVIATKDFENKGFKFVGIGEMLKTVLPTILIVIVFSWVFSHWMIEEHTKKALLINILLLGASTITGLLLSIPFNRVLRLETKRYLIAIKQRL